MNKIKMFLGKGILLLCLFIVCLLFITRVFEVKDNGALTYATATTILIAYLYRSEREK